MTAETLLAAVQAALETNETKDTDNAPAACQGRSGEAANCGEPAQCGTITAARR